VAINKLKDEGATARNRASALEASLATPDSTKWVPKADHDLALNRIKGFEAAEATRVDAAITAAVDAAIAAGKVAPASRDYHVAACRQDGGLERFQAMVGSAPAIVGAADTTKPTPGATDVALNAEERAVADQLGMSHADFASARNSKDA
jgi:phage I-like protein